MTNPFVLPEDVQIVPLAELPPQLRTQVEGDDQDFAVTRPKSRVPSRIIDAQAASLLREFQKPSTLLEAIVRFSKASERRPAQVLEEAWPFLESCLSAKLLVEPGALSETIRSSFAEGDSVAGCVIEECIQTLTDTELYRVKTAQGPAALKITRAEAGRHVARSFEREAKILSALQGRVAPKVIGSGELEDGRSWLLMEWIPGERAGEAAETQRRSAGQPLPESLLRLCLNTLDAYTALHAAGVIHSDVHPNNLLVSANGSVRIVDYGLARCESGGDGLAQAPRGGIPFFYEPEYASAMLAQTAPPQSSFAGEQYAIAAVLCMLIGNRNYLDFSLSREEMLRQIVEAAPAPLAERGLPEAAPLDAVLLRSLSKDPAERFSSVGEMAEAFRSAVDGLRADNKDHARDAAVAASGTGDARLLAAWLDSVLERVSDAEAPLPVQRIGFPVASLTYGAAGIACGLLRIASARGDAGLLSLADRWLDRAFRDSERPDAFYHKDVQITPETVGRVSPYHTLSGAVCMQALLAHARGDFNTRAGAAQRFLDLSSQPCENPDLTLGRSSTLMGLSLLLDVVQSDRSGQSEAGADTASLPAAGKETLAGLWAQFDGMPSIAAAPSGTSLGMAHGWAGYLYATLRWMQSSGTAAPAGLDGRLAELAAQARWSGLPSGQAAAWPFQTGPGGYVMGGWCNGSAGFVFLWELASRVLKNPEWLRLAEGAGHSVAHSPDDYPSLCCGLAGMAYSQLALYRSTRDSRWLENASRMAVRGVRQAQGITKGTDPYLPLSLYKGDMGLAALIADLAAPDEAAMPFFEDERWPRASSRG